MHFTERQFTMRDRDLRSFSGFSGPISGFFFVDCSFPVHWLLFCVAKRGSCENLAWLYNVKICFD
jgi:hypothetical protein